MSSAVPLTAERIASLRTLHRRPWALFGAVAAWVLLAVLAVGLSGEGGCTAESPCEPDWWGSLEVALCLAAPVLLLWVRELGLVLSGVAAAAFTVRELQVDELPLLVFGPLVLLVLLLTAAAAWSERVIGRDVDRALADLPRERYTGPATSPSERLASKVLLVVVLGVAAAALAHGALEHREQRRAEARASSSTAVVVGHGDDGYLITVRREGQPEGALNELDTALADDYPVGSTQQVLVGSFGTRLVAEPYDGSGWTFLAASLVLLAGGIGWRRGTRLRAVRSLLTEPQPALAVRAAPWDSGVGIYGADDEQAPGEPLVVLRDAVPTAGHADARRDAESGESDDDEGDGPAGRPWSGLLLGVPHPRRAALLVADDLRDGWLLPGGVCRAGGTGPRPFAEPTFPVADQDEPWAEESVPTAVDIDEADADLDRLLAARRLTRPQRAYWTASAVVGLVGVTVVFARDPARWTLLWQTGLAAAWFFGSVATLVARVARTDDGLLVRRLTRSRTYPWSALKEVEMSGADAAAVTWDDDVVVLLMEGPLRRRSDGADELKRALQRRMRLSRPPGAYVHPVQTRVIRGEVVLLAPALAAFTAAAVLGVLVRVLL